MRCALVVVISVATACGSETSSRTHADPERDAAVDAEEPWNGTPTPCEGVASSACRMESLEVAGVRRPYLVTGALDAACTTRHPLVIGWHGSGSNGEYLRRRFALQAIGGEAVIMVYPDGLPRPELGGRTGWDRSPMGGDIALFDALPAHVADAHCVDATRVFSVGSSRGGRFTDVLGCHRGRAHRALASISAGTANLTECPERAPMWISHGRFDKEVLFIEGEDWLRRWAGYNRCATGAASAMFPDDACTELAGCEVAVVWCPSTTAIENGHGVPPFAVAEVDRFFARFR